jgi:hypothetical protein
MLSARSVWWDSSVPRIAAAKRDLSEPCEGVRPGGVVRRLLASLDVESLGLSEISQAQSDLGLEELCARAGGRIGAGGEKVLSYSEPSSQLTQKLEGGDAIPGLDPRDVRGRAAGERQLALAEAGPNACGAQTLAHRLRAVDVG